MRWIYAIHNRLNIFQKVLIANAVLLVLTGVGAAALAVHVRDLPLVQRWLQDQALTVVIMAFLAAGLAVSLGINWIILRVAFLPLFRLREVMGEVRAGQFHARAPAVEGDPDVAAMGAIFNEMLDRLDDYRRATASQVLRALEEERKRIARELHDQTSQVLTTLLIHLDLLRDRLGDQGDDVAAKLAFIRQLTSDALEEIRRLTFDLRPTILDDLGLVPAVRWYVQNVLEPAGIEVELRARGFNGRLKDEIETALFRIVQEALTNILKHSRATRAQVLLRREPGGVSAEIRDNGVGFDPRQVVPGVGPDPGRGLGLFGMRERAALVGGRIDLHSRPGQGTRLRVWIPLDGPGDEPAQPPGGHGQRPGRPDAGVAPSSSGSTRSHAVPGTAPGPHSPQGRPGPHPGPSEAGPHAGRPHPGTGSGHPAGGARDAAGDGAGDAGRAGTGEGAAVGHG